MGIIVTPLAESNSEYQRKPGSSTDQLGRTAGAPTLTFRTRSRPIKFSLLSPGEYLQMCDADALDRESLDPLLTGLIQDNREKVVGWMLDQPGCWGFLAGKAITACRQQAGRSLTDEERRWVWHRLWWWLEQIKRQTLS